MTDTEHHNELDISIEKYRNFWDFDEYKARRRSGSNKVPRGISDIRAALNDDQWSRVPLSERDVGIHEAAYTGEAGKFTVENEEWNLEANYRPNDDAVPDSALAHQALMQAVRVLDKYQGRVDEGGLKVRYVEKKDPEQRDELVQAYNVIDACLSGEESHDGFSYDLTA